MPTYVYACTECEHRFEAQQAFTDDALTDCPNCSGKLRKVFNSVGIVFKGSGFYRTDSRSNGKASETVGSTASSSGSDSTKSTTSSDSSTSSGSSTGATSTSDSKSASTPAKSGSGSSGSSSSSSSSSAA